MHINPILYEYGSQKILDIYDDYKNLVFKMAPNESITNIQEYFQICENKNRNSNVSLDSGIDLSVQFINIPNILNDGKSAYEQIKALVNQSNEFVKEYDYKTAQHPYSFFRGTLLKDLVNPFSEECINPEVARQIIKQDVSLFDTEFGKLVRKTLDIEVERVPTTIKETTYTETTPFYVKAFKFITKNKLIEIIARALTRIPILELYLEAFVEFYNAFKEIKDDNNATIELAKATLKIAIEMSSVAILGAIGSYYGPLGSIIAVWIGIYISSKLCKAIG